MHGRGSSARSARKTSTTPSITPAVAVESATTSGCSDSTSEAMSCAGAPGPSSSTSQPSASRKSATIRMPDRVQLLRRAGDDRQPAVLRRAAQAPREPVEDRLRDRGRVVLLGDVERAHRPAVPDLAQRRVEHLEVDVRDRDALLERVLDRPPRPRGITRQQGGEERVAVLVNAHRTAGCQEPWTYGAYRVRRAMA